MKTNSSTSSTFPRRQFIKQVGYTAATAGFLSSSVAGLGEQPQTVVTLALVGCAHIHTPNYIGILRRRRDVKVKCVWDHDKERAERRAKELGCPVAADPDAIWSDPEIKGVVICSETNRHHDLVMAAVKAGKNLFVEKPLGITAAESNEMASAIERARLLFTTGYFMRTQPEHLFLKEHVGKGSFGKITRVRGSNCHNGSLGHWFDTEWRWMADPAVAGVGAFGDLGTHSLDLLMWFFGDVDSVAADIKVVTGHYGDCDESGEALLKFHNKITGTLAAGWVDLENPATLMISGTEGHAILFQNKLYFRSAHVPGADGKQAWTDLPSGPPEPMDQFVEALAGREGMPLVTPREAAARVSVMEAAYRAAKQGAWATPASPS